MACSWHAIDNLTLFTHSERVSKSSFSLFPITWHNPRRNPYEVMFPVDEFSLTLFVHPFGKHISQRCIRDVFVYHVKVTSYYVASRIMYEWGTCTCVMGKSKAFDHVKVSSYYVASRIMYEWGTCTGVTRKAKA